MKEINAKNKRVLFISDQHMPYHHKDMMRFLREIKRQHLRPTDIIINMGDEIDSHACSFHDSNVDLFSAGHELEQAKFYLKGLEELFPKMYLVDSNHGSLFMRRIKHHGIPITVLKPMNEILGVSKKWSWHEDILLQTKAGEVYVCHGKSGAYDKLAMSEGKSAVQGHYHGRFGITWFRSRSGGLRFNMFTGCLVDYKSLSMEYGRNNLPKPILGVGFLDEHGSPRTFMLHEDRNGNWDGKLR
jgi:hypothetical protein